MPVHGTAIPAIMPPDTGNGETPRKNVNDGGAGRRGLGSCLRLWISIAVFSGLALDAPSLAAQTPSRLELTAKPLASPAATTQSSSWDRLTWMGGLILRAPGHRFGGVSALYVAPDGSEATALTDQGSWLRFPLRHDAAGRLTGAGAGLIAPLLGLGTRPLGGKWNQDAESLARLADGSFMVAFEHNHRIWHYPSLSGPATALPAPPDLSALERNHGIEALIGLAGGGLLAIAEGETDDTETPAFLRRDGRWHTLSYRHERGFRPSGAARLPNGDILVMERFFSALKGVRIRLVRVPGAAVRPGARLSGETIATLRAPLPLDNMEGIAVRQGARGETLIYLISDDNFSIFQRTLLMLFALKD